MEDVSPHPSAKRRTRHRFKQTVEGGQLERYKPSVEDGQLEKYKQSVEDRYIEQLSQGGHRSQNENPEGLVCAGSPTVLTGMLMQLVKCDRNSSTQMQLQLLQVS